MYRIAHYGEYLHNKRRSAVAQMRELPSDIPLSSVVLYVNVSFKPYLSYIQFQPGDFSAATV
jgi:hypothetical protein